MPVVRTNNKTAEMIKYASNSILATLISFSNEIGNLCAALGELDVADVLAGVHLAHYFTTVARGWAAHQGADHVVPLGRLRIRRQLPSQGCQGAIRAWNETTGRRCNSSTR